MKRFLLVALVAVVVPAIGHAKGPESASISGPNLKTVSVSGNGEGLGGFGGLVEAVGFFPAVFAQTPDPMLPGRPKGDLGPRYTITWVVPGPNSKSRIKQNVYPYAKPYAVTYMRPGQPFWDGERTHGGWYVGDAGLSQELAATGLLSQRPTGSGSGLSTGALAGIAAAGAAVVALALLAAARLRRRLRPAVAA